MSGELYRATQRAWAVLCGQGVSGVSGVSGVICICVVVCERMIVYECVMCRWYGACYVVYGACGAWCVVCVVVRVVVWCVACCVVHGVWRVVAACVVCV